MTRTPPSKRPSRSENIMARRKRSSGDEGFYVIIALAIVWVLVPEFRTVVFQVIPAMLGFGILFLLCWGGWHLFKKLNSPTVLPYRNLEKTGRYQTNQSLEASYAEEHIAELPVKELTISEKLRRIDWFQFEKLIELIYRQYGCSVQRLGGANPDGGVDLIVETATDKFVVQCKQWKKWTVGVRQIREFLGTMTDSKIPNGIYITLSCYTGDAKQLADKHGIHILNESDVIRMLEENGLIQSPEIAALLADTRKFCPKCENELVVRKNRKTAEPFWGCSTYPRCNFTLKSEVERGDI